MSAGRSTSGIEHDDLVELAPMLRRVIAARVREVDLVEDLVQEALARVMAARRRLEPRTLAPYAVVTARNPHQVTGDQRAAQPAPCASAHRSARAGPPRGGGAAPGGGPGDHHRPGKLPEQDQEALVAHEVEGTDTATLAARRDSTPGPSRRSSAGRGRDSGRVPPRAGTGGAADRPLPPGAAGPVRRGPAPPAGPGRRRPSARLRLVRPAQRAAARPKEDRLGGR